MKTLVYFEFEGEPWFITMETMFRGSTVDGLFVPEICEIREVIVAKFSNFEEMEEFLTEHEKRVSRDEKAMFRKTLRGRRLISPEKDTAIFRGKRAYAKVTGFLRTILNMDRESLTPAAWEQIADLSKFAFFPEKVTVRE